MRNPEKSPGKGEKEGRRVVFGEVLFVVHHAPISHTYHTYVYYGESMHTHTVSEAFRQPELYLEEALNALDMEGEINNRMR